MKSHRGITQRGLFQAAVSTSFLIAGGVSAAPMSLSATQNQAVQSAFTLDFGVFGGIASAEITDTQFNLVIDPVTETARFLNYLQHVNPLILPDGSPTGISTGAITVEIIQSNGGSYNRATGEFITDDLYAVHFTEDLSAFGIQSPFILPSTSTGRAIFSTVAGGSTDMEWIGTGQLATIPFNYTCGVHGSFTVLNAPATGFISTSLPTSGAIDARQPHGVNDSVAKGWKSVDITFNGTPLAAITGDQFAVDGIDANGLPLGVADVVAVNDKTFTVQLTETLEPGSWARVTHTPSGTSLCLGYLPGDVNGDRLSNARDISALIDSLNAVPGRILPDYATDINRSTISNAMDIARLIDLLNGAGAYAPWLAARLGSSPCS